jgi:hypothetical protein
MPSTAIYPAHPKHQLWDNLDMIKSITLTILISIYVRWCIALGPYSGNCQFI